MAAFFRGVVLRGIEPLLEAGDVRLPRGQTSTRLLRVLRRRKWVVYAKRPFKESAHLVEYLGRYTHRVAISDARVVALDEGGITFRTREQETCRLDDVTFLRRFLQHVLPRGFRKIRHYGLYAPGGAGRRLEQARALLAPEEEAPDEEPEESDQDVDWRALLQRLTGIDLCRCPCCGAHAVLVEPLGRGPPAEVTADTDAAA